MVLLTGATGFIGRNIYACLIANDHHVRTISRSCGNNYCHMTKPEDWRLFLIDIDVVINCVGIISESPWQKFDTIHAIAPTALFKACERYGVRRVIQISALSTNNTALSPYHITKHKADDFLRRLNLDWFILKPSLIYGRGGKSANLFKRLSAMPLIPVINGGNQKLQPIHINDVVATIMACMTSADTQQTLNVIGQETVTFSQWLQLTRRAQGIPTTRLLHIPFNLAVCFAFIGKFINPIIHPNNLRMLRAACKEDCQPLINFLGRPPLKIDSHLFFSDFETQGDKT